MLPEVERIQSLIAQGRAKDSLARLDELQRKYPRVTFLNFIRASLLVVLGDQGQALSILGVALRDFPQNESGREMYRTISQGKEPPLPTQAPSQSPATVSPKRVPASLPSANPGRKK